MPRPFLASLGGASLQLHLTLRHKRLSNYITVLVHSSATPHPPPITQEPQSPEIMTNSGTMAMLQESIAMLITLGYLPTLNYIMKSRWLSSYIGPSAKDKRGYGYLIGVTIDLRDHKA